MFVIKKKSGKWRLLQDLRAVNTVIKDMGALQPGLPSPVAIPKGWHVTVIDLQDCFFTIKLHPADSEHFAFSVPAINFSQPYKGYQWVVLPQGMKNSPTLCQKFVAGALEQVRKIFPTAYIIHYMDDILLAHADIVQSDLLLQQTIRHLTSYGLVISPEKVQKNGTLSYLGHLIKGNYISPQKVEIRRDKLKTLNDFQKLLGEINWLRPYLKLTTGDLSPLYSILQGDSCPRSPRNLTTEAIGALQKVEHALTNASVQRLDYSLPWQLLLFATPYTPTAALWQKGILEWLHLPHIQARVVTDYPYMLSLLIIKGRERSWELFGKEPAEIVIPYNKKQLESLLQNHDDWAVALQGYLGQIKYHYPKHPLLEFIKNVELIFPCKFSAQPLPDAILLFTDGSSTGRSVVFSPEKGTFVTKTLGLSAQQAEIKAVTLAFQKFPQAINLYTDSKYVVNLFPALETALITGKTPILLLLKDLQKEVQNRQQKFFIGHIRAHSKLPGSLAQGNALADLYTQKSTVIATLQEATQSHSIHHQNANALRKMFSITREQARQIVKQCGSCPLTHHSLKMGVNPRGLKPNSIWQMDVTHISSFGKLGYVHVVVDTFSHFVHASARTGEAVKDIVQHLLQCFQVMGLPSQIKTDNAPAYTSKAFETFCVQWNIAHITGIPYNPQGQGIIERTHQTLKTQIERFQKTSQYFSPHHMLSHALFVINHLNLDEKGFSHAWKHWDRESLKTPLPLVMWKDLLTGSWQGPDVLITSGRGYACVFPQDADSPVWIPNKLVKPVSQPQKETHAQTQEGSGLSDKETHT